QVPISTLFPYTTLFRSLVSIENGAWGSEMDGSMQPVGLPQEDGSFIMAPYRGDHKNIKKFFQTGTILQQGVSISGGNLTDGFVKDRKSTRLNSSHVKIS